MNQLPLLPLGTPIRLQAGEVGPVSGYGCAPNAIAAADQAERQLRIKALQIRAQAVVDVMVTKAGGLSCVGKFGAQAHGIAVASWALPPSY